MLKLADEFARNRKVEDVVAKPVTRENMKFYQNLPRVLQALLLGEAAVLEKKKRLPN